jgi:hypothetical protein
MVIRDKYINVGVVGCRAPLPVLVAKLTMLSVAQPVQRRVVRSFPDGAGEYYEKNVIQDIRCPGWDSNRTRHKYKSGALRFSQFSHSLGIRRKVWMSYTWSSHNGDYKEFYLLGYYAA